MLCREQRNFGALFNALAFTVRRCHQRTALLAIVTALFVTRSSNAQQANPTLRSRTAADSTLTFDFICQTANGAACPMLPAKDLRVHLDGKRLPEVSFNVSPATPQMLLLLDAINTPLPDLGRVKQTALDALTAAGDHLPCDTSIFVIADTRPRFRGTQPGTVAGWELLKDELYVMRVAPSHSGLHLAAALQAWQPALSRIQQAQAVPGGSERVRLSLQALGFLAGAMKEPSAPKLILWISPGWPVVHMTQGGYPSQIFDSIVYYDDLLRGSRVMLSMLDPTGAATDHAASPQFLVPQQRGAGPTSTSITAPQQNFGSDFYKNYLQPPQSSRSADPNDMLLPVLAIHSGGTAQTVSNNIADGITRFLAQADRVYTLRFSPTEAHGKDPWHSLTIDTPHEKQTIHARAGYYAR